MKLEMSLKKNVVGDLKFWKYFRTRFAGTHPPRLLVSPVAHWLQRQKILVILMGHQKMPKIWDVLRGRGELELGCVWAFLYCMDSGVCKVRVRE